MSKNTSLAKLLIPLVLISGGIVLLILVINEISSSQIGITGELQGYPPPFENSTSHGTLTANSYPVPSTSLAVATSISIISPSSTSTRNKFAAPVIATLVAAKLAHTPSASEISALDTEIFERSLPYTPPAVKPRVSFPVNSIQDIPNVIYSDPFFKGYDDPDFGDCLKAGNPGHALFVQSLDDRISSYYLLPFFRDNQVCGVAIINLKDGMGSLGGWSESRGDKFPAINKDEAIKLVMTKTGQKVVDDPVLIFQKFLEMSSPFSPFWKVNTADGYIYFVIFRVGIMEIGAEETIVEVVDIKDMHQIK